MKEWKRVCSVLLTVILLGGCAQNPGNTKNTNDDMYTDKVALSEVLFENEAVVLAAAPPISVASMPEAPGTAVEQNGSAVIDYSNVKDGYVMVKFTASTDKKLKVRVTGPSGTQYTYNLTAGEWTTFPLSDGNGSYQVTVFENTTESKYATVLTANFSATLTDEFAPFLRPNQYVNYEGAANTAAKAAELAGNVTDPLEKVAKVYDFVIHNLSYDREKARTVQSGYLPVLDEVLAGKTGICFDYAALMAAMLRLQGVPCKLVVGYAGTAYHAWISVWTESAGWLDGVIYFDGSIWQRMDPTFASSSNSSDAIMKYIGNGENYVTKYLY